MEAGHASGREGNRQMARVSKRSTATAVRDQIKYAVRIWTNNRTTVRPDSAGMIETVIRTEFFGSEAEAVARVEAYEQGRTRVNATEAELRGFFPWNDHNGHGEYFAYRCRIHQCETYPPAPSGIIYGFAIFTGLEIHEYI